MGRFCILISLMGAVLAASMPMSALAQPLSIGRIDAPPIAILDRERLFTDSLFGQRVQQEIAAASVALATENREIEAELLLEEQELTEQRSTMDPAEFAVLAEEFDQRVEGIRTSQAERLRDLNAFADNARALFIQLSTSALERVLAERGAAAVLDSRAVIFAAEGADITDIALQRIDQLIGDGGDLDIFTQLPSASP